MSLADQNHIYILLSIYINSAQISITITWKIIIILLLRGWLLDINLVFFLLLYYSKDNVSDKSPKVSPCCELFIGSKIAIQDKVTKVSLILTSQLDKENSHGGGLTIRMIPLKEINSSY